VIFVKLLFVFLALAIAGATHSAIAYALTALLVILFWWPGEKINRDVLKEKC